MNLDPSLLIFGIGSIVTVSATWGATKLTVGDVKKRLEKHEDKDEKAWLLSEARLTRLETMTQEIHRVVCKSEEHP